jgi:hypothetical protein
VYRGLSIWNKGSSSQAFWEHQTCSIPTPYKPVVKFVQNWFKVHFSSSFWGAPICSHAAKTTQGLKGRVLRKEFVLSIESWFFIFFHFYFFAHGSAWCHLQCDSYNLNVKFFIFLRNLTRSIVLKFWIKAPVNKKNFSSFIITKYGVEIWAMCAQLDLEVSCKRPKKKRRPSNFHEF